MWTMNADLLLEKGSGQIGAVKALQPVAITLRIDLAGVDDSSFAAEDRRMEYGYAAGRQVGVNGCLVSQHPLPIRCMYHAHDLSPTEWFAPAAPVTVGHADVAPALRTGFFFHTLRYRPVEKPRRTGAAMAVAACRVVEECGETPDDFALVQTGANGTEVVMRESQEPGSLCPRCGGELLRAQTLFE